jgi:hypothetical protein
MSDFWSDERVQWIRQRICITHSITTDRFDEYFTDSLARARSAGAARSSLLDYLSEKHGSGAAVFFSCQKFLEDYEGERERERGGGDF